MGTTNVTFAWASNAQGWVYSGGDAYEAGWTSSWGNPSGGITFYTPFGMGDESSYVGILTTWEALGVPSGTVVTQCQMTDIETRAAIAATLSAFTLGPLRLCTSGGSLRATLWTGRYDSTPDNELTFTHEGSKTAQNVPSDIGPSATQVMLFIDASTVMSMGSSYRFVFDNLDLVITWEYPSLEVTGSGGATFGGAATCSLESPAQELVVTGAGGATFGGSATSSFVSAAEEWLVTGSGGASFGGSAYNARTDTETANNVTLSVFQGRLHGDFDVVVDFASSNEPATEGWRYGLVFVVDETHYLTVGRQYTDAYRWCAVHNIGSDICGSYVSTGQISSGSLRIVRVGSNVTAYYKTGASWIQLGDSQPIGSGNGYVALYTANWGSNPDSHTYFDNFDVVSADEVTWFDVFDQAGAGGVTFGGAAEASYLAGSVEWLVTGAGGITLAGAADANIELEFTYVASGGITTSGAADYNIELEFTYIGAGGITTSGAADYNIELDFPYTGSGGATFGGAADLEFKHVWAIVGTDGITLAGAADYNIELEFTYIGAGGATFGGAADITLVGVQLWIREGTGGITLSGAADYNIELEFTYVASGGITTSGAADYNIELEFTYIGTGGISVAGAADANIELEFTYIGTGGISVAGAADANIELEFTHVASGGLTFGGAAITESPCTWADSFTGADYSFNTSKWYRNSANTYILSNKLYTEV